MPYVCIMVGKLVTNYEQLSPTAVSLIVENNARLGGHDSQCSMPVLSGGRKCLPCEYIGL